MAKELENAYFRKLRMIYCGELQLISLLPELSEQITDFKFGSSIQGLLRLCRERRDALEMIASEHAISPAGDDCDTMRKLVTEGRDELRHCSRGQSRDDLVADVCVSVHRLLVVNYGMARNLAARLGLSGDADRLEELIDLIVERFPQTCEYPSQRTAFSRPALAIH